MSCASERSSCCCPLMRPGARPNRHILATPYHSRRRGGSQTCLLSVTGWAESGREMRRPRKPGFIPICVASAITLAGCSSLPDSGPSANDVATRQVDANQLQRYLVVDIDPTTVDALKRRSFNSFYSAFGDHRVSAE